jgi:hypothetical protein
MKQQNCVAVRYTGINVTLYGRGEAVAMNYAASSGLQVYATAQGKEAIVIGASDNDWVDSNGHINAIAPIGWTGLITGKDYKETDKSEWGYWNVFSGKTGFLFSVPFNDKGK